MEIFKQVLRRNLSKGEYELIKKNGDMISIKMSTDDMKKIFSKDSHMEESFAISKKVADNLRHRWFNRIY